MAVWFGRKASRCRAAERRIQELLNSCSAGATEECIGAAVPELRKHLMDCAECRAVLEEALEVRRSLQRSLPAAEDPGAAFTARVMGTIASQKAARMPASNPWFAVPPLAARMACVAAVALLLMTTWLYRRPPAALDNHATTESAGASLEPAQPANRDEVFASLVEREP